MMANKSSIKLSHAVKCVKCIENWIANEG